MLGKNYIHITKCYAAMLLTMLMISVLAVSCDVHEFPDDEAAVSVSLRLEFDTDMTQSEYINNSMTDGSISRTPKENAQMRYVIRFYNRTADTRALVSSKYREFVFERTVDGTYDGDFVVDVPPGDYSVMAWADFVESPENSGYFYDAADFSNISLLKPHIGNSDYRDAFRGETTAKIAMLDHIEPVVVTMERPLAKYEFVSTDLREFLEQEAEAQRQAEAENSDENSDTPSDVDQEPTRSGIDLNNYRILFVYSGYMPNVYNMFTDKPVDSTTGIAFEGKFSKINDDEISLGFDYVIVNHMETTITLRVAVLNDKGEQVSLTNPINVPIKRSNHTIVKGRFLMEKAKGSVGIDPNYDGEFNIIINN